MSRAKRPLKIAVDLDGVLAESMIVWCELANKEFGTQLKIDDLDTWASWRTFGISKNDFYRLLDESWQDWKRIPPTEPNIASKVSSIRRFGELDVVTGRSEATEESARKWIDHLKIPYDQFVRVPGWREKADLGYDVFIDDAPDLMPLISRGLLAWAILYDRPWNRNVQKMRKVVRAKSWTQIPKLLERIQSAES